MNEDEIKNLTSAEVEETEPTVEICPICNGIGNLDEGAGFNLDCKNCDGTGFINKE